MEGTGKTEFLAVTDKAAAQRQHPTASPAQHPQGAGRIRKAAKPPTAAPRVAVGSEEPLP